MLAVAPEIDLKYETLFAYLNNDITRKWPTFDLALRTSAAAARQPEVRRCLLSEARLFGSGLLWPMPSADRRSWLATGFSAAPAVCHYLWSSSSLDPSSHRSLNNGLHRRIGSDFRSHAIFPIGWLTSHVGILTGRRICRWSFWSGPRA